MANGEGDCGASSTNNFPQDDHHHTAVAPLTLCTHTCGSQGANALQNYQLLRRRAPHSPSAITTRPVGKSLNVASGTLKLVDSSRSVCAAIHSVIEIDW